MRIRSNRRQTLSSRAHLEGLGESFLEFLFELGKDVDDEFPLINAGGCGIYAAEVGHCLKQLGFRETEILVQRGQRLSDESTSIDVARQKVQDVYDISQWKAAGISMYHLVIQFTFGDEVYLVDVDGYVQAKASRKRFLAGSFTVEEMVQLSRQRYMGWNDVFDDMHRAYRLRRFIRRAFHRFLRRHGLQFTLRPTRRQRHLGLYLYSQAAEMIHRSEIASVRRMIGRIGQENNTIPTTEENHVTV